jgi:hypothetical protein
MRVHKLITNPPTPSSDWHERWEGPDKGLVSCWLRGIEKAKEDPALATKAKANELPPLPWKGGVEKSIKRLDKVGALSYLAAWQGLRGENLDIDLNAEVLMTCQRTGVPVLFTSNIVKLLADKVDI